MAGGKEIVTVSLDADLLRMIEERREHEARSSFVNRMLRLAMGMQEA